MHVTCTFAINTALSLKRLHHVQEKLEKYERNSEMFVVLSDVWLDQPAVMEHLRMLLAGYEQYCPKLFIFVGNFASRPFGQKYEDSQAYKVYFMKIQPRFSAHLATCLLAHTNTYTKQTRHAPTHSHIWRKP